MNTPFDTFSPPSPTRARLGVLGFCCSLSLITYLDRICIMRARSDIQSDLSFTDVQMGFVFGAFSLGYAIFEVPGGWMGDRWGARRVLARIVLCWSLFTALTGCIVPFSYDTGLSLSLSDYTLPLVFNSLVLMVLIRFLFGIGEAGAYPNLARVVGDWFPFHERGRAQGAIWMSARFGGAIAPLVIGSLTLNLGWQRAFWVLGLVGVVWTVFFLVWFRDRPELHPACNSSELALIQAGRPPLEHDTGHAWPGVATLARSVTIWAMCSASFWVCFGWYFYPTWQPAFYKEVFGVEPTGRLAEVLTGLPFLCGASGCMIGGRLSDYLVVRTGSRRWGRALPGLIGFSSAGVCVLATGFVAEWWQAVTLLCLAFFLNDLAIPVMWATCADIGGRYVGSVSGLMNMIGALGAILSPILIPNVKDWLPADYPATLCWRIIFTGLAGAWFLAALAWLFIDASKRLVEPQPQPRPPAQVEPAGDAITSATADGKSSLLRS